MFQPGQKKSFVVADVVAQRDEQAEDRVLCQNCSKFFKARKNVPHSLGEPLNSQVWAFTTWKQEVDLKKKKKNTYFPIQKKKVLGNALFGTFVSISKEVFCVFGDKLSYIAWDSKEELWFIPALGAS